MPKEVLEIRKVRNKDCYQVRNKKTKEVYAKCTTRDKALKQMRLLETVDKEEAHDRFSVSELKKEMDKPIKV